MSAIKIKEKAYFDTEKVQVRDFVRAQYHTWPGPRNGIVVSLTDDVLTALFLPAIHQAACYFSVKAEEVRNGKWCIRYLHFDGWDMNVEGDDFADEYNPAPAEDGSDSSAADGE